MASQPTVYPDLNHVLTDFVAANRSLLAGDFVGAYLHGSFALGDADEASDVDYMIVVEREIEDARLPDFEAIQARIFALDSNWAKHLEGSYITRAALRRHEPDSPALLYFDNGSVVAERSHHDNSLVVRWQLREKGITLAGPDIRGLVDPVPVEDLRREVLGVMRSRGDGWFAEPENLANRFYQPFAVLTYCRMLHTLATGRIVSKPAAAAWAGQSLDPCWKGLIQRAVEDRPNPSLRYRTPADPEEVERTLDFIRYAIVEGERIMQSLDPGLRAGRETDA